MVVVLSSSSESENSEKSEKKRQLVGVYSYLIIYTIKATTEKEAATIYSKTVASDLAPGRAAGTVNGLELLMSAISDALKDRGVAPESVTILKVRAYETTIRLLNPPKKKEEEKKQFYSDPINLVLHT